MRIIYFICLIMVLLFAVVACNKDEQITQTNNVGGESSTNNQVILTDLSFEERTREAKSIIYIPDHNEEDYYKKEYVVTNASLEKEDEHYKMTLAYSSPILFEKEEIDEAYNKAQELGTYEYKGFSFYKDNDLGYEFDNEDSEGQSPFLKDDYEAYKEEYILVKTKDIPMLGFTPLDKDSSKYLLFELYIGFPNLDKEKLEKTRELDVILLPDDKVVLNDTSSKEIDTITVEQLYNMGINGDVIKVNDNIEFHIDLSNLGDCINPNGFYQNAITFSDCLNINYNFGGI